MDCPSLPNRIAHRRLTECRIWSLGRFDWAEDMQAARMRMRLNAAFRRCAGMHAYENPPTFRVTETGHL